MAKFTVIVSFTGECCAAPHLWQQTVTATNDAQALAKVLRSIAKDGGEPHDYVVFSGTLAGKVKELAR